jgi:hypothetical protein
LQVPLPLAPRTTLLQVSINGIPELDVLLLEIFIQIVGCFNPLPNELVMVRQEQLIGCQDRVHGLLQGGP